MPDFDTSANSVELDCSADSGICVEVTKENFKKKLLEFKRILFILERDKEANRLLRERLSRIAERKTNKKKKNEKVCNVCSTPIDSEDSKKCIACYLCTKYVCRGGENCSKLLPKDGEWICRLCSAKTDSYGKTSSWVEEQYKVQRATPTYAHPMRARSEIYIPLCDPNDSAFLCNFESVSEAPSTINVNQKQQIREYIEEVLSEMLGGSLDSTIVGPMSKSENYIPIGNENELQGISHVRLRRLIESIIAETVRLPAFMRSDTTIAADASGEQDFEALTLNGSHCNGIDGQYFEPKKYQDLLATAVLNKIVDTHVNERHSESSPDLTSSAFDKNHNSLFPNKTDDSISSSSSFEPRSDSSLIGSLHNVRKGDDISPIGSYGNFYSDVAKKNIEADNESILSDFLASHMVPLPHISAEPVSDEEEDDEDFISVASSGRDTAWEDNWLFKKKRSNKIASSIGMLVPAPKEDIRALIGDKPTDEVSDLSEIGSDTDDSSLEMVSASLEPLNDRFINQHLIGGKNTKDILDELVEQSSMISTSYQPDNVPPYTETKNEFVVINDGFSETETSKLSLSNCNVAISNEAVNSNVSQPVLNNSPVKAVVPEKEANNSEEESIVPPPNDFTDDEKMRNLMAKFKEEQSSKADSGDENSSSLSPRSSISCALSGSIAEREYKKWNNAVDMPNNPYSAEALKHRLNGGPDRVIDLPNISPSTEEKPIILAAETENNEVNDQSQERDYARYSRDYYINDAKHASGATKKRATLATTPTSFIETQLQPSATSSSTSSIEVIRSGFENRNRRDWTLSTPVRRSSSLKYPKQLHSTNSTHTLHNDDDDDTSSQHSSRSLRTQSAIKISPNPSVLTQFEKQLLHKDLKRNSFRAISSTTKDFVLNPIFDQGEFFTDNKLSVRKDNLSDGNDDAADSGVDSCFNGVPGDGRRTSLLF